MMLMSSSIFVAAVEIRADKTPSLRLQAVAFNSARISGTWLIGLGFTLDFPRPHKVYKCISVYKFSLDKLTNLTDWCEGVGVGFVACGETSGISRTAN